MLAKSVLAGSVLIVALAAVGACSGGSSTHSGGSTQEINFHGEAQPLQGFSFDTGLQPAASPVQVEMKLSAGGKLAADATAIAGGPDSAPSMVAKPATGAYSLDAHFTMTARLKVNYPPVNYDGDVPGVSNVAIAFLGSTTFDPFLLSGKATATANLPETQLPPIPLQPLIGVPGNLVLTIKQGSTMTSDFQGTCAAVSAPPGAQGQYVGETTTSGTLIIEPSVVFTILGSDKTFNLPQQTVPIPPTVGVLDLGKQPIIPGGTLPGGDTAMSGTCSTAPLPPPDGGSDGPNSDGHSADGPNSDGPSVDGPNGDGPSADGPNDGPSFDGNNCTSTVGDGICQYACEDRTTDVGDCAPLFSMTSDARRIMTTGDWASGQLKAECGAGQAMTGLSIDSNSFRGARGLLCSFDFPGWAPFNHTSITTCYTEDFSSGNARADTSTGDWNPNNWKGECGYGDYVAGIAHGTGGDVTKILCCQASLNPSSCVTHVLSTGTTQETPNVGDWDVGYAKGECGSNGRYVKGVSQDPLGGQDAILCCGTVCGATGAGCFSATDCCSNNCNTTTNLCQ